MGAREAGRGGAAGSAWVLGWSRAARTPTLSHWEGPERCRASRGSGCRRCVRKPRDPRLGKCGRRRSSSARGSGGPGRGAREGTGEGEGERPFGCAVARQGGGAPTSLPVPWLTAASGRGPADSGYGGGGGGRRPRIPLGGRGRAPDSAGVAAFVSLEPAFLHLGPWDWALGF